MKRFFCTSCQRVKRVKVLPPNVAGVDGDIPEKRLGECRHHSGLPRLRPVKKAVMRFTKKPAAPPTPPKAKRTGRKGVPV